MRSSSRSYLVDLIRRAFAATQYPGDDRIVYDNREYNSECVSVFKSFRGRHWTDVTNQTLEFENAGLHVMTPEARAYYLPAYMVHALVTDFADSSSDTLFSVLIGHVDIAGLIVRLNKAQQFAICEFLNILSEENPEELPLNTDVSVVLAAWGCGTP